VKFDVAEDKYLVRFYAVLGQWFMMIRRFLCPSFQQFKREKYNTK